MRSLYEVICSIFKKWGRNRLFMRYSLMNGKGGYRKVDCERKGRKYFIKTNYQL